MSLFRLLLHRSGGQLDVTDLSKESGLSRPTVLAHLEALETAHAIMLVAPGAGGGSREIVRRPRCMGSTRASLLMSGAGGTFVTPTAATCGNTLC